MHFLFPLSKTSKTDIEQVIAAASQGCIVASSEALSSPTFHDIDVSLDSNMETGYLE
jgi:hypothetical protein